MTPTVRALAPLLLTLSLLAAPTADAAAGSSAAPRSAAAPADAPARAGSLNNKMVLAISVDGLTKNVFRDMGRDQLPNLWRLLRRGVSTRNARTEPEQTITLPNHVGMVTGRRVAARHGGHGVTWNWNDTRRTVHDAAGERVLSVFNMVRRAGGTTAVFATKSKFSLFNRSWRAAVEKNVIREGDDAGVTWRMRRHLRNEHPTFTFLHLSAPDRAGHRSGFMSADYRRAVRRVDGLVGKILRTRANHRALKRRLAIILTSDHGGKPGTTHHSRRTRIANFKVPFAIYARWVDKGRNIYALSPAYRRPGSRCRCAESALPPHRTRQPVRNGDVANVSLALLGLGPVPGSLWGHDQRLHWR